MVELAPYYYRDNFMSLCDTVEAQYDDLLEPLERAMLQRFRALEFRAQCLYVRLVSRVGPWFREDKLSYSELGEVGPLLDVLLERNMAVSADALSVQDLGRLYTRAELLSLFKLEESTLKSRGKPSLLEAIESLALEPAALAGLVLQIERGRVIAPLGTEHVGLLQLLFFGNRHQGLTEFVLSDLGVARYYPYPLDRSSRVFPDRPALDEYLSCAALSDRWYELGESDEPEAQESLAADLLAQPMNYASTEGRWYRLCNSIARDLERRQNLDLAYRLYGRSRRHPARERRARILERREDWSAAAALCDEILADPWNEEEREAAMRILARVARKLGGTPIRRRRDQFDEQRLVLPRGAEAVELQVAAHLGRDWQSVHYVENRLMQALFGLVFWEQIFMPLPGAFHNPYQSVPADMYDQEFYPARQQSLDARLAQLRSGDLRSELLQAYRRYSPWQCRWVNWRAISEELVDQAAGIIPAGHLLAIWERLLFDPRENRRGFPDLIAFGDSPGDYRLIEVKGPGDALQDSQRRWLRFFAEQAIPAGIAWVAWDDD